MCIERILHGCVLPPIDITSLIPAGDEDRLCMPDDIRDLRRIGCLPTGNNQRRYGVGLAERIDVGVVVVIPGGAQNQKISSGALFTEKTECFIKIRSSTHQS